MTVFLPIKLTVTGGTSTFARKLQAGLAALGHEVVYTPPPTRDTLDYDILLASPRAPLHWLLHAKRHRKPIVHRLDGVYYPATTAGWKFPLYNAPLQLTRALASFVVYQSRYSKYCCDRFLGPSQKSHTIIYNGVDTALFSPTGEKKNLRDNPDQHVFITTARFRRPDQIVPLLKAFKIYRDEYHSNSKFVIIGNFTSRGWLDGGPPPSAQLREHLVGVKAKTGPATEKHVEYIGSVPNESLPAYLRAADVFLFSHQNPPCPNNVIEAMASGLPICGVADGAMTELISSGMSGMLLPAGNQGFLRARTLDPKTFAANLNTIMKRRDDYATNSRARAMKRFRLNDMASRYTAVFAEALKHAAR